MLLLLHRKKLQIRGVSLETVFFLFWVNTKPKVQNQYITIRQRTARYLFVHSSALFLYTFFAYFTLAFFLCCIFSRVASCCTRFKSHFFCVALSCTFSVLHFFHIALFSLFTFFVLYTLCVALFSWCTLFMLHLFSCCTVFMLYLLCTLFMLHFFRVVHYSCCTFSMLHSFHVELFSFTFFVLSRFHVKLFCVALLSYCTFSRVASCWTLFMLHFLGSQASNFIKRRLHYTCLPVKFVKLLNTPILKNICKGVVLKIFSENISISKSHNIVILQRMNGLLLLRSVKFFFISYSHLSLTYY